MIIINNSNFKKVIELGLTHEESVRYNKECFSTIDIRREMQAKDNIDKLLALLLKEGVDLECELSELAKDKEIKFFNGSNFKKSDRNFSIKYKLTSFEDYLREASPELIVKDEPIVTNNMFHKSLEIDSSRFCYEQWEVSEASIKYLENYCNVFKSSLEIINMACKYYTKNSTIKEIHCIRDTIFSEDVNASKYVVFIENDNHDRMAIVIQADNSIKDAILFNCKSGKTRYIIPLDGADRWYCREYDENLNAKISKFISKVENYRDIILNN